MIIAVYLSSKVPYIIYSCIIIFCTLVVYRRIDMLFILLQVISVESLPTSMWGYCCLLFVGGSRYLRVRGQTGKMILDQQKISD